MTSIYKAKVNTWKMAQEKETKNKKERFTEAEKEERKKKQEAYIKKHGPQKLRRKTLAVTDKYKEIREQRKFSEAGFKPLRAGKDKKKKKNYTNQ